MRLSGSQKNDPKVLRSPRSNITEVEICRDYGAPFTLRCFPDLLIRSTEKSFVSYMLSVMAERA